MFEIQPDLKILKNLFSPVKLYSRHVNIICMKGCMDLERECQHVDCQERVGSFMLF